jgi:hypothetical protein
MKPLTQIVVCQIFVFSMHLCLRDFSLCDFYSRITQCCIHGGNGLIVLEARGFEYSHELIYIHIVIFWKMLQYSIVRPMFSRSQYKKSELVFVKLTLSLTDLYNILYITKLPTEKISLSNLYP